MAEGIREKTLSKLERLREHGVPTIRKRLNDISELFQAGLTNQVHYWPMHDHMGELVHESQKVRQSFLNWLANYPDVVDEELLEIQNQEVVLLNDPMMGHAGIIARGNRVLHLMAEELELIISCLHEFGNADVEVLYELVSNAITALFGLVEEGADLMVRALDDQTSDKESTSDSSTSGSSP